MAGDDVQLPDLEVIRRFSLAVRAGTAPRAEVIAALRADLAYLLADDASPARARARPSPGRSVPAGSVPVSSVPGGSVPAGSVPAGSVRRRRSAAAGSTADPPGDRRPAVRSTAGRLPDDTATVDRSAPAPGTRRRSAGRPAPGREA